MMPDIKEALYIAEFARINGAASWTPEKLCEALTVLKQEYERMSDELDELSSYQRALTIAEHG